MIKSTLCPVSPTLESDRPVTSLKYWALLETAIVVALVPLARPMAVFGMSPPVTIIMLLGSAGVGSTVRDGRSVVGTHELLSLSIFGEGILKPLSGQGTTSAYQLASLFPPLIVASKSAGRGLTELTLPSRTSLIPTISEN